MRRPPVLLSVLALIGAIAFGTAPALANDQPKKPPHHAAKVHKPAHRAGKPGKTTAGGRHHPRPKPTGGKASAARGTAVINDCQDHGQLTKTYPKADLRKALAIMSAATKQYSDCQSIIQEALAHDIHGGGSGSGGGGTSTTTIVIIVVVVVALVALLVGGIAVRRRRGGGGGEADAGDADSPTAVYGPDDFDDPGGPDGPDDPGGPGPSEDPTRVRPPGA